LILFVCRLQKRRSRSRDGKSKSPVRRTTERKSDNKENIDKNSPEKTVQDKHIDVEQDSMPSREPPTQISYSTSDNATSSRNTRIGLSEGDNSIFYQDKRKKLEDLRREVEEEYMEELKLGHGQDNRGVVNGDRGVASVERGMSYAGRGVASTGRGGASEDIGERGVTQGSETPNTVRRRRIIDKNVKVYTNCFK